MAKILSIGRQFEKDFLGYRLTYVSCTHVGFKTYVEQVKMMQKGNPHDPPKRLANNFHYFIAKLLGLEDDLKEVALYNSLGTQLDDYYGTDFFITVGDRIVTIDLTTDPWKNTSGADFILHKEETKNENRLKKFAEKVAKKLKK